MSDSAFVYAGYALAVLSIPLIVGLARLAVRHSRELNQRIEDYRREEEEAKSSGQVVDPYSAMATVMGQETPPDHRSK